MGKFDGVLLASDYDETLCTKRYEVPPANVQAIRYFTAQGGTFTVSTGRARPTFAPQVHKVPFNAPVILAGGSILYDFAREEILDQQLMPAQAAADLLELSRAFPQLGLECYHGDDIYIHAPNEYTRLHMLKLGMEWTAMDLREIPTGWSKVVIQASYCDLLEGQKWLAAHYGGRYEVIFSNRVLLECTAKGANKGSMVLRLAQRLGIQRENVYCVGDNQNDIPMLAVSAIPFAPGGCDQTVRDWGARLLCPCEEGCIAQIVELLDRRYSGT